MEYGLGLFRRAAGICPGDCHFDHGTGLIGLTLKNDSCADGAGEIVAFEPLDERCGIPRDFGIEPVYNPCETDFVDKLLELADGLGTDVHVETIGTHPTDLPLLVSESPYIDV